MEKEKGHETRLQPIHSHSVSDPHYMVFLSSCRCSLREEKYRTRTIIARTRRIQQLNLFFWNRSFFFYIPFFVSSPVQTRGFRWSSALLLFHTQQQLQPSPSRILTGNRNSPIIKILYKSLRRAHFQMTCYSCVSCSENPPLNFLFVQQTKS